MPTLFCKVPNLTQEKLARVQSSQEDTGGDESSGYGSERSANLPHVPPQVQILQQILPQCPHSQVPHVKHPQGAEEQRRLELQILWSGDRAKQDEVHHDPEAHEERAPHHLHHQLGHSDYPARGPDKERWHQKEL